MSDEEDYMSDAVLAKIDDVRPGLLNKKSQRDVQVSRHHKKCADKSRTKPKHVQEKEKRDEGLQNAIGADNKGFAMLKMMGFKPGMVIGKQGTGRTEPVPIQLKTGRTGLGHEAEVTRKRNAAQASYVARSKRRQLEEEKLRTNFRSRMMENKSVLQTKSDLYKSQKVCEQLDSTKGLKEPENIYFWPKSLLPAHLQDDPEEDEDEEEEKEEDEERKSEDEDDSEVFMKLEVITQYLRNTHLYCIWCGTAFNDVDDLAANCPGDTSAAHDD